MIFVQLLQRSSIKSSNSDLINYYVSILAFIVLAVAYLDLAVYLQAITGGGFLPKYAYYLFGVAIAPLFLFRNKSLWPYLVTPYVFWTAIMVAMNLLHWMVFSFNGSSELAALTLTRIQTLILAALIGFLLIHVKPILMGKIFLALAILLTVLQLIDFLSPGIIVPLGTEGVVPGRASSTLLNANKAAESLVLLSMLGIVVLRPAWRIWFLLLISIGVILTFSRSGILVLFLLFLGCFWFKLLPRNAYFIIVGLFVFLGLIFTGLLNLILSFVDIDALDNIYDRILFFSNPEVEDYSAKERFEVVEYAIDSFMANPFLGNGSGYTHFWSISEQAPHNQHLLILTEYGLMGYALFAWLIVLIFRGNHYFCNLGVKNISLIGFVIFLAFTPFTHNMLDYLYWLLTFFILGHRAEYIDK